VSESFDISTDICFGLMARLKNRQCATLGLRRLDAAFETDRDALRRVPSGGLFVRSVVGGSGLRNHDGQGPQARVFTQTQQERQTCDLSYSSFCGFAVSSFLGLTAVFGLGAQKSGQAAVTSAGGLLNSGKK